MRAGTEGGDDLWRIFLLRLSTLEKCCGVIKDATGHCSNESALMN